jgi:hypothetical protein
MNPPLQKTRTRLLALGISIPEFSVDGDYGKEADDAVKAEVDQLVTLLSLVATPTTWLPPPAPTTSIDTRDKVV